MFIYFYIYLFYFIHFFFVRFQSRDFVAHNAWWFSVLSCVCTLAFSSPFPGSWPFSSGADTSCKSRTAYRPQQRSHREHAAKRKRPQPSSWTKEAPRRCRKWCPWLPGWSGWRFSWKSSSWSSRRSSPRQASLPPPGRRPGGGSSRSSWCLYLLYSSLSLSLFTHSRTLKLSFLFFSFLSNFKNVNSRRKETKFQNRGEKYIYIFI